MLPGTHGGGFSAYTTEGKENNIVGFERRIEAELVDEDKAVYFSLQPKECSLHEARIIHGARANTSERRRASYTMRYFLTTSLVLPDKNPGHKLWLARGRDLAGNTYQNA